jgi:hypothetical protein
MFQIKELLKLNIEEEIPLVIKAQDQSAEIADREISQYIVTRQIEEHLERFLEKYLTTSTDKIGVWISGFFGSGKSYFAKILGYLLQNYNLPENIKARHRFAERLATSHNRDFLLGKLDSLNKFPTHIILFEIITKIGADAESIQQIMFKLLLKSEGFSRYPTIAVMENEMTEHGYYSGFRKYVQACGGEWEKVCDNTGEFRRYAVDFLQANFHFSRDNATEFLKSAIEKYNHLTPSDFAYICLKHADVKQERIAFLIDEMGQYLTSQNNEDRLLQLQAIVEEFASKGKGKLWIIVTSQEKLNEIISNRNFDFKKLSKLNDRFDVRLDLTSDNVDEVARQRLLVKKPECVNLLENVFQKYMGNILTLSDTESIYPKTEKDKDFIEYYPFLKYQFHVIPEIVRSYVGITYAAATERKFIFIVDSILKRIQNEKLGSIVNMAHIFDALGTSFFGGGYVGFFQTIDDYYIAKTIKASDILKIVIILRNLPRISTTEENIAKMLCTDINQPVYKLQEEVHEMIENLIQGKYITRQNGLIHLVTVQEKEFIDSMEQQYISKPEQNKTIVQYLENLYTQKELKYGNGSVISIQWRYGDHSTWGRKSGITIDLVPVDNQENPDNFTYQSVGKKDLLFTLPQENSNVEDTATKLLKLEKTLSEYRTRKNNNEVREVLDQYSSLVKDYQNQLNQALKEAYGNGQLIYQGEIIPIKGSLWDQIKKLMDETIIPGIYTEIVDEKPSIKEIQMIFTENAKKLCKTIENKDYQVFDSNGDLQEGHRLISPVILFCQNGKLGSELFDYFSEAPYAWPQETILYICAALIRAGKLEVNNLDDFTSPEIKKILTTPAQFKSARLQVSRIIPPDRKEKLIDLFEKLPGGEELDFNSPPRKFYSTAKRVLQEIKESYQKVQKNMEELGSSFQLEIGIIGTLLNHLENQTDSSIDELIENKTNILNFNEKIQNNLQFIDTHSNTIRKEKSLVNEIIQENQKGAFISRYQNEIETLISEFQNTLPQISQLGTDIHTVFEKLRNQYRIAFQDIHQQLHDTIQESKSLVDQNLKTENPVGKIAQEQGWFKEFTQKFNQQPCPELQINYSTKCENCHKSIHEAQLEVQNIENTILNFKMALQSFFQELPEPDLKITPQSKSLALPSKLTLRDLKKRINDIQLPPETVITITLEELK